MTPFIYNLRHVADVIAIIRNNLGEQEVDPHNSKGLHEKWINRITQPDGSINYQTFQGISPQASELLTKYLLDMSYGKNLSKGAMKGRRSFQHISNSRHRLRFIISMFETRYKKYILETTEDEVIHFFTAMRDGVILNKKGTPHLCVCTYAKIFAAFWRWIVRTKKKEGVVIPDIVENLDTAADRKPKWSYFTLQDTEKMALVAPNYYYKTLVYLLFDSGVRAPKELMNIRAMDITEVPGTNYLFLAVRNETSKTFGRKIKLMICSDILRSYIKMNNLKGTDFLFTKDYTGSTRIISRMGYKALQIGQPNKQKSGKVLIQNGVTMYDFRHNSVCHYLPIYKSENQMKYRYGWKNGDMINYYSEFMGMKDTITDEDMLIDTTKTEIQQQLQKEQLRVAMLEEQLNSQKKDMDEKIKQLEQMMLQKFANNY